MIFCILEPSGGIFPDHVGRNVTADVRSTQHHLLLGAQGKNGSTDCASRGFIPCTNQDQQGRSSEFQMCSQ